MKTIWDIKGEFNKEFETLKKIQVEMKMREKTQQPCQKTQWKALPTLTHLDDKHLDVRTRWANRTLIEAQRAVCQQKRRG